MTSPMQLLACRRCRSRKLKCDKISPRCSACEKSNSACIILDPDTGEEYPRETVAQLELREKWLHEAIAAAATPAKDDHLETAPIAPATPKKNPVGASSEIGTLDGMFSHPRWTSLKTHLLERFNDPQSLSIRPPDLPAAELPSREKAEYLVGAYLQRSHIHRAFLSRRDLLSLVAEVYDRSHPPRPQDVFRLFVVCAISATVLRHARDPAETHPYSYFSAAQGYLHRIPLIRGMDGILNLLLIARYAGYCYIGTSVWALSRMCIRTCLQLELHLPPLVPLDPLEEQHRRFVFWDCYVNDRYSSQIMGRPFAVRDSDIKVKLPVPYADHDIARFAPGQLDSISTYLQAPCISREANLAISFITLNQISSEARRTFCPLDPNLLNSGTRKERVHKTSETRIQLRELLDKLQRWRDDCPYFEDAPYLYLTQEWSDLLVAKERLSLVRAAINAAGIDQPPDEFISLCRQSAQQIISLYARLYDADIIRPTRGYFQTNLIAGLSVVFCISSRQSESKDTISDGDATSLQTCSRILWMLSDDMPDARSFACAFDLVREHMVPGSTAAVRQGYHTLHSADSEARPLHEPQMHQLPSASLRNVNVLLNPQDGLADDFVLPPDMLCNMEADVNLFACGDGSSYLWSSLGIPGRNPAPGELYW